MSHIILSMFERYAHAPLSSLVLRANQTMQPELDLQSRFAATPVPSLEMPTIANKFKISSRETCKLTRKTALNYLYGKAIQRSIIQEHMESNSATFLVSTNCCAKLQSQSRSACGEMDERSKNRTPISLTCHFAYSINTV